MITMLHLSDLHTGADVDWENLKARILENAATLRKLPAGEKMLILTGDYRFYRDTNYNSTEAFLRQLIDIMQIDPVEDLFLIPGNHDVANQQMMKTLFLDDPDWAQKQKASIELIKADSQNIPMYLDWRMDSFLAFDELAERLGARKKESRPSGVYVSTWRNKLNILHLNTVLAADGVHKDNQKLDVLTAAKDETWAGGRHLPARSSHRPQ